jgi:hypothetical protein
LPSRNKQVKRETKSIVKNNFDNGVSKLVLAFQKKCKDGRLKETELARRGSLRHAADASLVRSLCASQSRREKLPRKGLASPSSLRKKKRDGVTCPFIPVISKTGISLMPCHPARARELVRKGKAVRRFKCGIFYLRLTERENGNVQEVVCGIDPGSKREGFTVKDSKKDYVNILSDAVDTVKDKLKTRRDMRRARRFRKTPCRQNRYNRKRNPFPPSTKARWDAKLRIVNILRFLYPISIYVVEDIKAKSKKGKKKWNVSFSPLEVGKKYFYSEIMKLGKLVLKQGYETAALRQKLSLKKSKEKLLESFDVHNVDSWVLAYSETGGKDHPENKNIFRFVPLNFYRRQLQALQSAKHGERRSYGGTRSLGITRGTVIKHFKYGMVYVGGNSNNRISVHDIRTGKRLAQNIKARDMEQLYITKWRVQFLPHINVGVSLHN